jgi:hypothetical protein
VPFRTQGYFINEEEATKLSNITKPCNNMHYKAGKYSRKGVIVCRGIQSAYKMGSIPTYPQDCSLTYYEFLQDGSSTLPTPQIEDRVCCRWCSRYTNSRTWGCLVLIAIHKFY